LPGAPGRPTFGGGGGTGAGCAMAGIAAADTLSAADAGAAKTADAARHASARVTFVEVDMGTPIVDAALVSPDARLPRYMQSGCQAMSNDTPSSVRREQQTLDGEEQRDGHRERAHAQESPRVDLDLLTAQREEPENRRKRARHR